MPETHPILNQQGVPPFEILMKFMVEADGMVSLAKAAQQIHHPGLKGPARPNHLSCVMKVAN